MHRPARTLATRVLPAVGSIASAIAPAAAQSWSGERPAPARHGRVAVRDLGPAFTEPALGADGRVAFWARYNQNTREGIFSDSTGTLGVVAVA